MTHMMRFTAITLAGLLLSGCSDTDAPSSEDPAAYMEPSPHGYLAAPAVTIGENATLVWFKALVANSNMPDGQAPAKIGWLEAAKKCKFAPPANNERLVQVLTNESGLATGIVALSDAQLRAQSTPEAMAEVTNDPAAARNKAAMKLVDVVVTDTSGPIYLVLAGGRDILWNIQAAPNARITHVAVVAGDNAGVVNLDPSVPVAALNGKAAADCGVLAARRPKEGWTISAEAAEGDIAAIDEVKLQTEKYGRYNAWFESTFGKESESVTIGISRMSHALIGPAITALEERLPYRGLGGGTVSLAPSQTVFYSASPEDFAKKMQELSAKAAADLPS